MSSVEQCVNDGRRIATRTYRITKDKKGGTISPGKNCMSLQCQDPHNFQDGEEYTTHCPTDCIGRWVATGICRGDGETLKLTYKIDRQKARNGRDCPAADNAEESLVCPTHCLGEWRDSADKKECSLDENWQAKVPFKTYHVTREARAGSDGTLGRECAREHGDTMEKVCLSRNCLGTWDKTEEDLLSECTGDGGTRTRTYTITREAQGDAGKQCEAEHGAQDPITCPTNCIGSWDYQNLTALLANECDGTPKNAEGLQKEVFRTYTISREAKHGGTPCDAGLQLGEQAANNTTRPPAKNNTRVFAYCPVDCVGKWDYDSLQDLKANACTGNGETLSRTYVQSQRAIGDGAKPCPFEDGQKENAIGSSFIVTCPTDCKGNWNVTVADLCAGENTKGVEKARVYVQERAAANGGEECLNANNTEGKIICGVDHDATAPTGNHGSGISRKLLPASQTVGRVRPIEHLDFEPPPTVACC